MTPQTKRWIKQVFWVVFLASCASATLDPFEISWWRLDIVHVCWGAIGVIAAPMFREESA